MFLSVVAALVFAGSVMAVQYRIDQETETLMRVRQEQQALIDDLALLDQEIRYVQTDDYIIDAARDDLGMINPGEIRYMTDGN